jgi:hypothetical protein
MKATLKNKERIKSILESEDMDCCVGGSVQNLIN